MNESLESLPLATPGDAPGRELVARDEAPLGPDAVVISRGAARGLTSVHRFDIAVPLRETGLGWQRFTYDLPRVDPVGLAHLDDRGLVALGTEVRPGMVLVGQTTPTRNHVNAAEGAAANVAAAFGVDDNVRDTSRRCAPNEGGVVTRVALVPAQDKEPERAEVELTLQRPLEVGDLLFTEDGAVKAVGAIVDAISGGADVLWPGADGSVRAHKLGCAAAVLHARSIGPYSLVTQQPLAGKAQFGGQRVDRSTQDLLRERGADWVLHEMLTVKSDDVQGRVDLYVSIVQGTPACVATVPETTRVLDRELAALGFDVDLTDAAPTIRLLTDELIRDRSHGRVKKPETINYRTYRPEPDGLFCARIFGPVRDYECLCGALTGPRNGGQTCAECGVEIIQSKSRRQRMGHIELPLPVLHPWALNHVARRLGIDDTRLLAVLRGKARLDGSEPDSHRETGVLALRDALVQADGAPCPYIFETWPVLPPDLRPIVPLDGGRFATSDLNDLYRRLINRANRLSRLFELDAPDIILLNEHRMLQEALEHLVCNGETLPPLTGPDQRPLVSLSGVTASPHGHLSVGERGKSVDYSAHAWVVPDPARGTGEIGIPRSMTRELFKPFTYCALEEGGHVTTIKQAKAQVEKQAPEAERALEAVSAGYPLVVVPTLAARGTAVVGLEAVVVEGSALRVHPETLANLGARAGDRLSVHVPIDPRAVAEARALRPDSAVDAVDMSSKGWLGRAAESDRFGDVLMQAALTEKRDPAVGRLARLLLGRHETE